MNNKAAIIIGSKADEDIFESTITVLNEYAIEYTIYVIAANELSVKLPALSKEIYDNGNRVIIAGTRGDATYSNTVAKQFQVPVVGVPCRSNEGANTVESVFSVLQQPNEHAVANVALDAGQNAGLMAVQIIATHDKKLQQKVIDFKANLKNKILKADKEMAKIKFDYKTN